MDVADAQSAIGAVTDVGQELVHLRRAVAQRAPAALLGRLLQQAVVVQRDDELRGPTDERLDLGGYRPVRVAPELEVLGGAAADVEALDTTALKLLGDQVRVATPREREPSRERLVPQVISEAGGAREARPLTDPRSDDGHDPLRRPSQKQAGVPAGPPPVSRELGRRVGHRAAP
jgi:hypothetical protein